MTDELVLTQLIEANNMLTMAFKRVHSSFLKLIIFRVVRPTKTLQGAIMHNLSDT